MTLYKPDLQHRPPEGMRWHIWNTINKKWEFQGSTDDIREMFSTLGPEYAVARYIGKKWRLLNHP